MKIIKRGIDFDKLIALAIVENMSLYAWKSFGEVFEKCELKIKANRIVYNEIELVMVKGQDKNLEMVVSGSKILNVYIPELAISFMSELKSVNAEMEIKIYPPSEYSRHERRSHERIIPSKTCYVSFLHKNTNIKRSIYDICYGGFAIVLPKSDKMLFSNEEKKEISFVLNIEQEKLMLKAECVSSVSIDRYKLESLPYGGHKLAFRFLKMSVSDRAFLQEYITREIFTQKVYFTH